MMKYLSWMVDHYFYNMFRDNILEYESEREFIHIDKELKFEMYQKCNKELNHDSRTRYIKIEQNENLLRLYCNFPYFGSNILF